MLLAPPNDVFAEAHGGDQQPRQGSSSGSGAAPLPIGAGGGLNRGYIAYNHRA